jgi:hypothetical protein
VLTSPTVLSAQTGPKAQNSLSAQNVRIARQRLIAPTARTRQIAPRVLTGQNVLKALPARIGRAARSVPPERRADQPLNAAIEAAVPKPARARAVESGLGMTQPRNAAKAIRLGKL